MKVKVIRPHQLETEENPRGVQARSLVNRKPIQVMNLVLQPGEVVEEHVTPVDVLFYVVQGKGSMSVGQREVEVKATEMVVSPKNIPHSLRASQKDKFEVLVIKTPNPKKS